MERDLTRREFLKRAGGAAVGAALSTSALASAGAQPAEPVPANEKIVLGLIGCGGMGNHNLGIFTANPDVEIAALCDVDQSHLDQTMARLQGKPTPYRDFRALLERKDIDAVIVATPDHWHALVMTLACEAGKDVYVEKPVATTIREGRAMVKAARRYGRVVQVGTQQRSDAHFRRAVEIVRSGAIGAVSLCRTWNCANESGEGIGNPPDGDPPPELDYDMWLGPAPKRPYNPNRCHYRFRYFWDYAGGKITDWGTHLIDIVQWAMEVEAPLAVAASGGKYVVTDNRETPDTMEAVYDYPGFTMVYSLRLGNGRSPEGHNYGMEFYGTRGTLFVDRGGFEVFPEGAATEPVKSGGSQQNQPHVREFLDCIRTRSRPVSDIRVAHRSTSAPHLGNIALHVGRKIYWDADRECIVDDDEANRLLGRAYRAPWHL